MDGKYMMFFKKLINLFQKKDETAYLFSSIENKKRLLNSLKSSRVEKFSSIRCGIKIQNVKTQKILEES